MEPDPGSQPAQLAAGLPKMSEAFLPQNPSEFDIATFMAMGRALPITTSRRHLGSRSTQLAVGGAIWSRRLRIVMTASRADDAPRQCPVTGLVELHATRSTRSPSNRRIASASIRSLSGVPVPWALT